MASVTDVCVDHDQRVVLLVDDVDAVQRGVDGEPEGVIEARIRERVTVPGVCVAQPARSLALQWRRSNAETVLS